LSAKFILRPDFRSKFILRPDFRSKFILPWRNFRSKFILRPDFRSKFILRPDFRSKFILRFDFLDITVRHEIGKRYMIDAPSGIKQYG